MKRELLFFITGFLLAALTIWGIYSAISFLSAMTGKTLSPALDNSAAETHFNIEGLKKLGVLPQ